ncbi:hypothetical protein KGD82_16700 [Nocardiopsis eucommiae]|uniref:Uncharacterized protein n=1 Tax=Nocardiopsis eucommiae TaxID=2831970 RepID=A0A975L5X7_9ACTN|nr:hypothetical protein KGD82_16700 [Nocardiopsis eucommiae]
MTATLAPATVLLPTPEAIDLPGALRITGTEAECWECGEAWELNSLTTLARPVLADVDAEVDSILADHHADSRGCALAA